ncbi:MAG: ribokinase [Phyllobacteriaceae bacterium]|nr:ribokinase [Phyllobacteriaceae bacterium]
MADILVVGALHHDVIVTAPRLPMLDETLKGTSVAYALGGKGGNQALSAARHGASVAFGGCIGSDEAGRTMLAQLAAGGVETGAITVHPTLASGMSAAIVTQSGEYGAVIVSAANEAIDAAGIDLPNGIKWLVLQNEIPAHINLAIAAKAAQTRVKIMLNAAPARAMDLALLALVDVLVVNRIEAKALAGELANFAGTLVETRGADGLTAYLPVGQTLTLPAFPVTMTSAHGAGDCFVGALAARLCSGDTMHAALLYAAAAAALHVSLPVQDRSALTPLDVFNLMETRHVDGH